MSRGRFITFEGGEGAGKSTQIRRLAERLRNHGIDVELTREPGGSEGAEALRRLLVEGEADRWSPTAETLLMYAARADHLERTIRPALSRGAIVLCDRFFDSTRAYQGVGGGVPTSLIAELEEVVVGADRPDLTLIFDISVEAGLARAKKRYGVGAYGVGPYGAEGRFEAKGEDFHRRLREAFLAIAVAEPARCVVIDAGLPIEAVESQVAGAVGAQLGLGLEPAD